MKLFLLYIAVALLRRNRFGCSSSSSDSDECHRRNKCNFIFERSRCRESSSSSSCEEKKKKHHKPRKDLICFDKKEFKHKLREDTDKYVFLIQEVIAQGVTSSIKLAQGFTNEIVRHLGCGVRGILKTSEGKACEELNRVEHKILEIIRRYSDEILHELDELVTTTNHDLLDNIIRLIKKTSTTIRNEIDRLPVPPTEPPVPAPPVPPVVSIELIPTVAIVNMNVTDLIAELFSLFEKTTNTEKGLLNKILVEKKNRIIKDITHELRCFRDFINHLLIEVQSSESKLINSTFDQSSKKLIIELDTILSQVGENIISIIKGCNSTFRLPLAINPVALSTTYAPNHLVQ